MNHPSQTESALRALYQSSLFLRHMLSAVRTKDVILWEQAMTVAKSVLEPRESETEFYFEVHRKEKDEEVWSVFADQSFSEAECDYVDYLESVRREMPDRVFRLMKYTLFPEKLR